MASPEEPLWHGVFIALMMFLVSLLQSFMLNFYFDRMFVIGMRIRACLTSAVYRKSLNLSNTARKETTMGEIVSYLSSLDNYLSIKAFFTIIIIIIL